MYTYPGRLKKRLTSGGFDALLLRKPPTTPPNKQITQEQLDKTIKLREYIL